MLTRFTIYAKAVVSHPKASTIDSKSVFPLWISGENMVNGSVERKLCVSFSPPASVLGASWDVDPLQNSWQRLLMRSESDICYRQHVLNSQRFGSVRVHAHFTEVLKKGGKFARERQKTRRGSHWNEMELQYEHIDWNDIVDAELSGDQETLCMLRSAKLTVQNVWFNCKPIIPQGQSSGDKTRKETQRKPSSIADISEGD